MVQYKLHIRGLRCLSKALLEEPKFILCKSGPSFLYSNNIISILTIIIFVNEKLSSEYNKTINNIE